MNKPDQATQFDFSWDENRALMAALDSDDTRASHYIAELERLALSYQALQGFTGERRIPAKIRQHLEQLAASASDLTSRLYEVPEEIRDLLNLHLVSEDTSNRIAHDLDDLAKPLADLAGLIGQLLRGELDGDYVRGKDPGLVLIRVLARAYRNHFNITVTASEPEQFIRSVRLLLQAMASRKMADAEQLLARLDSLLEAALPS